MKLHLLDFPPEIIHHFCKYLHHRDLKSFSVCSKHCQDLVNCQLWSKICIVWWSNIENINPPSVRIFEKFCHAKEMKITADMLAISNGQYPSVKEINFTVLRRIFQFCNQEKMKKLSIEHILTDEGLRIISNSLPGLQELNITSLADTTSIGWVNLVKLQQLRTIYLECCVIKEREIVALAKI